SVVPAGPPIAPDGQAAASAPLAVRAKAPRVALVAAIAARKPRRLTDARFGSDMARPPAWFRGVGTRPRASSPACQRRERLPIGEWSERSRYLRPIRHSDNSSRIR